MASPAERGFFRRLIEKLAAEPAVRDGGEGVWKILADRVDPVTLRPRLASDIEVKRFTRRYGNGYAMIANPRELTHYRLEAGDAELLPLMDGTRTVKEIVVERFRDSGDLELSGVVDLVELLRAGNFLTPRFVDAQTAIARALRPISPRRAKAREFVRSLSISWDGAHRFVEWSYRHGVRLFFVPAVAWVFGAVAAVGLVAFVSVQRSGRFSLTGGGGAALASLILLAMNYLLTFAHELAHAAVLVHYGRRVKSAGFMIYFGSPAFFVDSSDGLMLERRQRIVQAFGGPYAELFLAGAAAICVWAFPGAPGAEILYRFAVLNYFVIFLNLIPLLELDGYWILSDLIQMPDLRPRSLQFIRYDLWGKVWHHRRFTKQEIGLALYGAVGVAFTILSLYWSVYFWEEVFGSLVRALWDGGIATRVLLVALTLFVAGPVVRGLIAVGRSVTRRIRGLVRAIRFRLQARWRVEAARLIDDLPLFEDLPADVLSDLAGRVRLRSYPAGKPVFRQGERPEAFHVVRRGTLLVLEEDVATGEERVLRTIGRGESFGELGLVDGSSRTASVRARADSQLFEVDKGTFDRLLADVIVRPDFAPTFQAVAELRHLPAFATLGADDLAKVLEHGAWLSFAPGSAIIQQGEDADAFYAILSGQADVLQDDRHLRTMGPGSHFGEIALLMDVPRTASMVARTPMRVFRLDRRGFEQVVAAAFRRGTLRSAAAIDRTWQH